MEAYHLNEMMTFNEGSWSRFWQVYEFIPCRLVSGRRLRAWTTRKLNYDGVEWEGDLLLGSQKQSTSTTKHVHLKGSIWVQDRKWEEVRPKGVVQESSEGEYRITPLLEVGKAEQSPSGRVWNME